MHWGVAKKNPGEWVRGDDSVLPSGSIRWSDNVATQSPFVKDLFYPEFRYLQFVFKWIENAEAPVQAINFVLLEKNKNHWHNNGGQNFQLPLALASQPKVEESQDNNTAS